MKLIAKEYDPETGFTESFYYQDGAKGGPGKIKIQRSQDVEDQLSFNRAAYNSHSGPSYADSKGGAHHVARIPLSIIEKWKKEGFDWFHSTDLERRAVLNNPDNRHLLVRPGRL